MFHFLKHLFLFKTNLLSMEMEASTILKCRNFEMIEDNTVVEMCFSTIIKDVPRYCEFAENLERNYGTYDLMCKEMTCEDGFLAGTDHSFKIAFVMGSRGRDRDHENDQPLRIGVSLTLSGHKSKHIYVGMARLRITSKDHVEFESLIQGPDLYEEGDICSRYGDQNYPKATDAYLDIYVVRKKQPGESLSTNNAKQYASDGNLMQSVISKYFLSLEFSDATIECADGTNIPVHRMVLAGRSEYFGRMFADGMEEASSGVIKIPDFSSNCVKELLRFIYTGKPGPISGELCLAADKYGLENLKKWCETHLAEAQGAVTVENALDVYQVGLLQRNGVLQETAKKVISSNKQEFVKDASAFKELTINFPSLMFDVFKM